MMNRFIILTAFAIFVAMGMEEDNKMVPYLSDDPKSGNHRERKPFEARQEQFVIKAFALIFKYAPNPWRIIDLWLIITEKGTVTAGLRDSWIAIWISLLAAQFYQKWQGVLTLILMELAMSLVHKAVIAWIKKTDGTGVNKLAAALYALYDMKSFFFIVSILFWYYVLSGFAAFGPVFKIIMMLVAQIGSMYMYVDGWLNASDCKSTVHSLSPMLSIMSFFFSMFAMGSLLWLNAITFTSIGYMGGTYAALKMANIAIVSAQPDETSRAKVFKKINRIGEKIAEKIIWALPVVLPLVYEYSVQYCIM